MGRTRLLTAVFAAAALAAAPAATASAAMYTSPVQLTCTVAGNTGPLSATVTTTAPDSVAPGQTFTPSVQVALSLPAALFTLLDGNQQVAATDLTIVLSALPVDASGATPASLNWFATAGSNTISPISSASTTAPTTVALPSAAPQATGAYTVTGTAGGSVQLTLDTATGGVVAAGNIPAAVISLPITCTAPADAILATIPIATPGSGGAATPSVASISPSSGPAAGGTQVTINGSGFAAGQTVKFGAVAATSVTVNSSTQIVARSPAGAPGAVDVTVGGSATVAADRFTYVDRSPPNLAPHVSGVSSSGVRLRLSCPKTKVFCKGRLLLRTRASGGSVVLGSGTFSLEPGHSAVVVLRLKPSGVALVHRLRLIAALLYVIAHDSFGDASTATLPVKLVG
jgi:hypothetical protein